ncbi:MAG: hypothetical protein L3K18_01330 [Thermoplasmata archaeon]|nr:hypothetical protein [Thermoplasmata archaeon]MCI4355770.1 hypothetical protein [Thermoplasmata archaeon]
MSERFVPDPLAWGFRFLRFDLVRPQPGEETGWGKRFAAAPGAFHVWQGDGLVFAASFVRRSENPEKVPTAAWRLDADLHQPTVPNYFDFEGAWSRIAGQVAPRVYPRPLPRWLEGNSTHEQIVPERVRRDAEKLIRSPFDSPSGRASRGHLGSIIGFGRPRGALAAGLVQRRCFLDLAKLPGFDGWQLETLSFVTGTLRTGAQPEALHHELLFGGGMTPFLFATDRKSILIGALAPAPPSARTPPRTRISEILTKHLEPWTLVSTPVGSLSTPLVHRYDRLLAPVAH